MTRVARAILAGAILAGACSDGVDSRDPLSTKGDSTWSFDIDSCRLTPRGSAMLGLTLSPPPEFVQLGLEEFGLAGFDTIDIVGEDGSLDWSHNAVRGDRWRMNLSIREDPLPEEIQIFIAGVAAQARRLVTFSAERLAGLEGQTASEPFGKIAIDSAISTAEGTVITVRYPHLVLGNGALEGLPDSRLHLGSRAVSLLANSPGLDGDQVVADHIFEPVEDPDQAARFEVELWDFFVTDIPPLEVNTRSCAS